MLNKKSIILFFISISFFGSIDLNAQCFASSANPMGGSANLGVMNKKTMRFMTFYRYHLASKYYDQNKYYDGLQKTLSSANYNYIGTLLGYGLTDRLSLEIETGYFLNKTQYYRSSDHHLTGRGVSNALTSVKYAIYQDFQNRVEFSGAVGFNTPFSTEVKSVDGVVLPIDLQPSTASYGLVIQTYFIKEDSFNAMRYFFMGRYERNFENPQGYLFGNVFTGSAFISRHFVFGRGAIKDWTTIIQMSYQHKEKNIREGKLINASGGHTLLLTPQINVTINEKWNISLLYELPVYRYLYGIQLGGDYSVMVNFARDFNFDKR